jgi:hypothetical protein
VRAEPVLDSTRGPALPYPAGMRTSTILLPLLLILANDIRCKDDDASTAAQFGEPCGDESSSCAEGLGCYIGYCEEKCNTDEECQPVEGYRHECEPDGLCHIYCDEKTEACPQTLATPLECVLLWCESAL